MGVVLLQAIVAMGRTNRSLWKITRTKDCVDVFSRTKCGDNNLRISIERRKRGVYGSFFFAAEVLI